MPGLKHAWALCVLAGIAGCLDVPPYRPCAGDRDCDGWPAVAVNPAANDCDDDNVLVYPGAADDPETTAIEDCFATALASPLTPVAPLARGWSVGDLALEFDSTSAMPSSLRRGDDEVLAGNSDSCVRDERLAGVSLYPAFAVDGGSVQVGQATTLHGGPALATTRVTWTQDVPMAATVFGCDAATTATGAIEFTVHPSGRVVRSDRVTLSARVVTCAGCADPTGTAAIFTSYLTFPTALGRYQLDPATSPTAFPAAAAPAAKLAAPAAPITGCVSGVDAAQAQVGLAWSFPTPIAGMRARTTADGDANHAMVVDWVNRGGAAAGAYELVTAVAVETDRVDDCSRALRVAMTEFARPPTLTPTTFVSTRGTYRFSGEVGAGVTIAADQGVEGGATIEVPTFGQRGLTVWTSSGGAYQRLRRGQDYLTQYEADDTSVIYLPTIAAGSSIVIAGPGGEPPP